MFRPAQRNIKTQAPAVSVRNLCLSLKKMHLSQTPLLNMTVITSLPSCPEANGVRQTDRRTDSHLINQLLDISGAVPNFFPDKRRQ